MTNFSFQFDRGPDHKRLVTVALLTVALGWLLMGHGRAQTVVVLAPVPQLQFFDQSGRPLAFGCVFTYQVATTTPLATYTDRSGTTLNPNPVILSAGGSANVWLAAGQAYTFRVKAAGGTNCASGSTLYTVDGLGGGSTVLTTNVTYSSTPSFIDSAQIQLFLLTLTGNATAQPMSFVGVTPPGIIYFQITQDGSGGHSFSWPANTVGGCTIGSTAGQTTTQEFVYDGSNATATGPCVTGNGPSVDVGSLIATGNVTASQLISTVATSTPPLVVASTTEVTHLNANLLEGDDWASPGTIGSTAPNTAVFSTLQANTSFVLNSSATQTGVQGSDTHLQSAGTVANSSPILCTDANGGTTTSNCRSGSAPQRVVLASPVSMSDTTQTTILTESVTFPAGVGTYRADVRYGVFITSGPNVCVAEVVDATNSHAFAVSGQDSNGTGYLALSGSEVSANTYAAGATATFNLSAICNSAASPALVGATVNSGFFTLSPNGVTFLEVIPVLTN